MTTLEMESWLEILRDELERELRLLEVQTEPDEDVGRKSRRQRREGVSRILLELGSLQMRLIEADRR